MGWLTDTQRCELADFQVATRGPIGVALCQQENVKNNGTLLQPVSSGCYLRFAT